MTRQLDQQQEERTAKRNQQLTKALEFEFLGALQHAGASLWSFSIKVDDWQSLMTIRATVDGEYLVAHVGAGTIADCFLKCVSLAHRGKLTWKADKYPPNQT